jgi:hypothetical protein
MIASSSSRACTATGTGTAKVLTRRRNEWRIGLWRSNGTSSCAAGGGIRGFQSDTRKMMTSAIAAAVPNNASSRSGQLSDADRNLHYPGPLIGTTPPLPCASFYSSRSSSSFAFLPIRPWCRHVGQNWGGSCQRQWLSSEPMQRDEETPQAQPATIVASEPVVRGQVVSEEDVKKAEVHRTRLSEV